MDKKRHLVVFCDTEEEYAQLFAEYLRRQRGMPWELHTYTVVEEMLTKEQHSHILILVVSENAFTENLSGLQPVRMVILNESGVIRWENVTNINKYQQAEGVWKELLEIYMEIAEEQLPCLKRDYHTRFVGMYSPIHRCLQTSFAITMGQMLSWEHKTLYLNFEHYAGITELLPDMQSRDLADLLYFLSAQKEKFRLRFQTIVQRKGNMDYIPPMKTGQNLLAITEMEWLGLLQKIEELGNYEYVILDLSESMQGVFEILRMCTRIYTLTKEERIAQSKLMQYEHMLALYEYSDVLEKTKWCNIPKIYRLPEQIEQYTKGELAEYVKKEIKELCGKEVKA
ncbi:MAG: hypothetical protein IJF07_08910 [Lachnospiraceae bacterium]|nr:hypothetical protein [Lachnospiraceae bacterium]